MSVAASAPLAPRSTMRGAVAMLASTALFVINDSFMKVAMDDLPPYEVLVLRGISASLCCLALVLVFGQGRALVHSVHPMVLGRGLTETASVLCYIVALAHMPIADVVAIGQTAPLILILAASVFLREPVGRPRLLLIAAGFAGAVMVAQPSAGGLTVYAWLAFATAAGIAARDLIGRNVPSSVPGFVVTLSTCIMVMAGSAVMTTLTETWTVPQSHHLLLLGVAGLFVALGHFSIFLAYRFGRPASVAPFFYSFALWAVVSGFLVWGEIPNLLASSGIALIVASGLAIVLVDRQRDATEPRGELDL